MDSVKFWYRNAMNKFSFFFHACNTLLRRSAWVCVGLALSCQVSASSLDTLALFLKTTHSGRAEFKQQVSSPPKAGQPVRSKQSAGTFAFMRPNKFRFEYITPFAQAIVADGDTLWLYDVDLAQVTARKQSQTLHTTPAALIATATDLSALQKDFTLQAQADAEGLQWVQALPKNKDSSLSHVRVGLRAEGASVALAKLDILDALGQRSVLTFERFETNPTGLGAAQFHFVPPKGVDVIRP